MTKLRARHQQPRSRVRRHIAPAAHPRAAHHRVAMTTAPTGWRSQNACLATSPAMMKSGAVEQEPCTPYMWMNCTLHGIKELLLQTFPDVRKSAHRGFPNFANFRFVTMKSLVGVFAPPSHPNQSVCEPKCNYKHRKHRNDTSLVGNRKRSQVLS